MSIIELIQASDAYKNSFVQRSTLTKHLRTHTSEKPHVDFVINRSLQEQILRHIVEHTQVRNHFSVRFVTDHFPVDHLRHPRIHNGEKPYQCNVCETSFTDRGDLDVHA